jgi:small subunit ribosomal protein S5
MAYATINAFKELSEPEKLAEARGIPVDELVPWLAKARKEEADAAY